MTVTEQWEFVKAHAYEHDEITILDYIEMAYGTNYAPLDTYTYCTYGYHVEQYIEMIENGMRW